MAGSKVKRLRITFFCSFLLLASCSWLWAGDAVAIGYNKDGVWTGVTYYASSKPEGGKDYKTENGAREEAMRDLRKRSSYAASTVNILSSSEIGRASCRERV